jgi:hypothetical protein
MRNRETFLQFGRRSGIEMEWDLFYTVKSSLPTAFLD